MKQILRYTIRFFLALLLVVLLCPLLLYTPFIQEFAKNKAQKILAQQTGMNVSVSRVRLNFPLNLSLDTVRVLTASADTLLSCDVVSARVALLPLLHKEIKINRFLFQNAFLNYADEQSDMNISVKARDFQICPSVVDLNSSEVQLSQVALSGVSGTIKIGVSQKEDSISNDTTAVKWKISAQKLSLADIALDLSLSAPQTDIAAAWQQADIDSCCVDLYNQQVDVRHLALSGGAYSYEYVPVQGVLPQQETLSDTVSSGKDWTVVVGGISIQDNRFLYRSKDAEPSPTFNPEYVGIEEFDARIDTLYNRGSSVYARVAQLQAKEQSGLEIRSLSAIFGMEEGAIRVPEARIQTAQSQLSLSADVSTAFFSQQKEAPVSARLSGHLVLSDFAPLLDSLFEQHKELRELTVDLSGDVSGSWQRMKVKRLGITLPGCLDWQTQGELSDLLHPQQISGVLYSRCQVHDGKLLTGLLNGQETPRIAIPSGTSLTVRAQALAGDISPHLSLVSDSCLLRVSGSVSLPRKQYDIALKADSFPLARFLPADSLNRISLTAQVSGSGYDFLNPATRVKALLQIQRFDFRGYDYRDIDLDGWLENASYAVTLNSASSALDLGMSAAGEIRKEGGRIALSGDFRQIDLKRLNFSPSESILSFGLSIDASATDSLTFAADSRITGLSWQVNHQKNLFKDIAAHAQGAPSYLAASLQSGDFRADFRSEDNVVRFPAKISEAIGVLTEQVVQGTIDMQEVQKKMPSFRLTAHAQRDNFINNYLKTKNLQLKNVSLSAVSDTVSPFLLQGYLTGLSAGTIVLDSLSWRLAQADSVLIYGVKVSNFPSNSLDMGMAELSGRWYANLLDMDFSEINKAGKTGFSFKSQLEYTDSLLTYKYLTFDPVLGFERWSINPDNYVSYGFDGTVLADFRLSGRNKKFWIYSTENRGIQIAVSGIDLGTTLQSFPFAPPVGGLLAADVALSPSSVYFNVEGKLSVDSLQYNNVEIGDVGLSFSHQSHTADSINSLYRVNAGLDINRKKVVTLEGKYWATGERDLLAELTVSDFPLNHINSFIPDGVASLSGELNSQIHFSGKIDRPLLSGEIRFADTQLTVPMIGTSFGFSAEPIRIENNSVLFDRYAISGANKNALYIDGSVRSGDFNRYYADLRVNATDFQPVNISRQKSSMLYGKVNMDLNTIIRGELDELSVQGDIRLLNGTDATYVLQDSPLEVKDESRSMVSFVSFSDTTQIDESASSPQIKVGGLSVLMNVEIGQSVKMAVNLSDDGENRINLQGGGNLTYSQNSLGDSRFSGRYVLTGGTVRYNPPIISEKIFNIQEGSYVEWLGDIADPSMSITAVENVRATVSEDDKNSRPVNFDVIIKIQNTLDNLSVTFDLKATDDLSIQNQLASLTAEQRSTQAMNLLIYNTYTGPGTSGRSNITGNPLNSFIQQELNQWARNNLKNVDLTFGIDSYDGLVDGAPGTRTDYSYKLSKTLFNDRVRVVVGGSFRSDIDPSMNMKENLVDDISLEYMLNRRDNMFLKVFRHTGYESILEGEIVQTGFGFVVRKKLLHLRNLFVPAKKTEEKLKNE